MSPPPPQSGWDRRRLPAAKGGGGVDGHRVLGDPRPGGPRTPGADPRAAAPAGVGEGWLVRNVVKRLRRKLGDDAADPRYIVTEPRKGYRMAAGEGEGGG